MPASMRSCAALSTRSGNGPAFAGIDMPIMKHTPRDHAAMRRFSDEGTVPSGSGWVHPASRSAENRRQDMALQHHLSRDLRRAVGAGVHGDDQVQSGHDIEALAAVADPGNPTDFAALHKEATEPP